jgi:hypothetical protein
MSYVVFGRSSLSFKSGFVCKIVKWNCLLIFSNFESTYRPSFLLLKTSRNKVGEPEGSSC